MSEGLVDEHGEDISKVRIGRKFPTKVSLFGTETIE